MEDLKDILNKALMEDKIFENDDQFSIITQFNDKLRSKTPKDLDMFGNKVEVGDLVLGMYRNRPSIGVIRYIRKGTGVCTVQYTNDGKDVKKAPSGDYISRTAIYDILKISNKVGKDLLR